ncbi:MAG: hypothetical protein AAB567_01185 [Patescibacteria group bacterium]
MSLTGTIVLLLVLAVGVALTVPSVHADEGRNKKLGELNALYWQKNAGIPQDRNPLVNVDPKFCGEGQPDHGNVYFLRGAFGGGEVERTCTIEGKNKILIPLVSVLAWEPATTDPKGFVALFADSVSQMELIVDGVPISREELFANRAPSPVFEFKVPEGGLLPAGTYGLAYADGYLRILKLKKGTHRIETHAVIEHPRFGRLESGVIYHLTIQHYADDGEDG